MDKSYFHKETAIGESNIASIHKKPRDLRGFF